MRRRLARRRPYLDLAGAWTLESFARARSATLDQWRAEPPEWDDGARAGATGRSSRRRWTWRCGRRGSRCTTALGREPRPLTLRELARARRPAVGGRRSLRRVEQLPDASASSSTPRRRWTPRSWPTLAGDRRASRTVDFKGRYGLEVEDEVALVAMYRLVLEAFPDALFEDPHEALERR